MSELRPLREGREKAEALRFEHSLGTAPIRDLFGLIERVEPEVLTVRRPMPRGPDAALLRARGRQVIAINTDGRVMRHQRFAAAHVLAHLLFEGTDPALTLHIDRRVLGSNTAAERRADSFAAHLLVPAAPLRLQLSARDPLAWTREELVVLSLEWGLSMRALLWHLGHVLHLSDAGRRHLGSLPEPTPDESLYTGSRAGLWELVRSGRSARDAVGWPRRYVALAARAYDRGLLSEDDLHGLLQDVDLVGDIVELGRIGRKAEALDLAGGWQPGANESHGVD
jgi:Zn-dependent peptidase ImmA (M78 family)